MFDATITKRLYSAGEPLGQAGPSAWKLGPPQLDLEALGPQDK